MSRNVHAHLTVHADRCVHQRIAQSSCKACVEACPHRAWSYDDEGLNLDTAVCDDCGQCVAACPHEALSIPEPAPHVSDSPNRTLLVACERTSANGAPNRVGIVACLHALSPDWVIRQSLRHHCTSVQVASADCSRCTRTPRDQSLMERWLPVAQRLGTSAPRLERISTDQWLQQTAKVQAPDLGRRRLFGRFLAPPSATANPPTPTSEAVAMTSERASLVTHLAKNSLARQKPPLWAPQINHQSCTACMACVSLCPQSALEHKSDEAQIDGSECIALQHTRCTGCGLCEDVCEQSAIAIIEPLASSRAPKLQDRLALVLLHCRQCKAPFHLPKDQVDDNGQAGLPLCPVCIAGKPHLTQRIVQAFDATFVRGTS